MAPDAAAEAAQDAVPGPGPDGLEAVKLAADLTGRLRRAFPDAPAGAPRLVRAAVRGEPVERAVWCAAVPLGATAPLSWAAVLLRPTEDARFHVGLVANGRAAIFDDVVPDHFEAAAERAVLCYALSRYWAATGEGAEGEA